MKIVYSMFLIMISTVCLTQYEDVIIKEEYDAWIVFKKNDTEFFAAKLFRYNEDPYYYAHDPKGNPFYDECAQQIWEGLEKSYNESHPENEG